jgi:hypothetical protein
MKLGFRVFHPVLRWFRVLVMMMFLFCALCLGAPSPLPVHLLDLLLPRRLVAVARAFLGMVNISRLLFRLLLLQHEPTLFMRSLH